MSQVVLGIPDDALSALDLSLEDAGEALRLTAAVKRYELKRISAGAAARLAGIPRVVFLSKLAEYGVDTFDLNEEDLRRETRPG